MCVIVSIIFMKISLYKKRRKDYMNDGRWSAILTLRLFRVAIYRRLKTTDQHTLNSLHPRFLESLMPCSFALLGNGIEFEANPKPVLQWYEKRALKQPVWSKKEV